MKKIDLNEVLDLTAYEKQRADVRTRIMKEKDKRRIHVGPRITYLFETYDTMWYQVQEMTRAERIVSDEGIMDELKAYNELIPDTNQLSASMLIEITDVEERKSFLSKIVDLPDHTYLMIDDEKVLAEFDSRQGSEDKLSSVQYLKFNLNQEQADKFDSANIVFGFDHKEYSYQYALSTEEKTILSADINS
jgi:hypothetical protein